MSTIGNNSFGTVLVAGRNRVPSPATGMTAFLSFMRLFGRASNHPLRFAFLDFLAGFAGDAKRRHRPRFQSSDADFLTALFADPIFAVLEPLQRFLNFENELALAITNAQNGIPACF